MTAIILAGGKATRMRGQDKAFLKIGNIPLIKRQLRLLKRYFKKIIIVTNSPQRYKNLKGVEVVTDIMPYQGPLGGIYSGLLASRHNYNFVVACDMPFINLDLIKYMSKKMDGFDVVVPKINNRYEPLFCIYSRNCLKYIKELLDKKIFKIRKFFSKVRVKEITKHQVQQFASPEVIFANINTKEDLVGLNG